MYKFFFVNWTVLKNPKMETKSTKKAFEQLAHEDGNIKAGSTHNKSKLILEENKPYKQVSRQSHHEIGAVAEAMLAVAEAVLTAMSASVPCSEASPVRPFPARPTQKCPGVAANLQFQPVPSLCHWQHFVVTVVRIGEIVEATSGRPNHAKH